MLIEKKKSMFSKPYLYTAKKTLIRGVNKKGRGVNKKGFSPLTYGF